MSERMQAIRRMLKRCRQWISSVWDRDVRRMPRWQRPIARVVRMAELVWRGFRADDCQLHASSLTFRSLMAIVPVLALSLALARVFGGAEIARKRVLSAVDDFAEQLAQGAASQTNATGSAETMSVTNIVVSVESPGTNALAGVDGGGATGAQDVEEDAAKKLAQELQVQANELFDTIEGLDFGKLGGVGLGLLLWMVISVLGKVEESFNRVWGVPTGRPLWRKFTEYLTVIIVLPFLAIAASTLSVSDSLSMLGSGAQEAVEGLMALTVLKRTSGWLMSTLLFAFVLMFMPNTRVKLGAGLIGGAVTALLFIVWLKLCTQLQIGVSKNNALFGSFALVPILLAWVYVSWEIVLFGAEVAFGWQNAETFRMEQGAEKASPNARVLTAVAVVHELARRMKLGEEVMHPAQFAHDHCISVRMVNYAVDLLVAAGLAAHVGQEQSEGLALLKSPQQLRVVDVVQTVLRRGVTPRELGVKEAHSPLPKEILRWDEALPESMNRTFAELVQV